MLAELSFPQASYLVQDVRMVDIRLASLVYLPCLFIFIFYIFYIFYFFIFIIIIFLMLQHFIANITKYYKQNIE